MVLIDVTAFLPGSLVDVRPVRETQYLKEQYLSLKLLKLIKHSNIVVSEKLLYWVTQDERGEMLSKLMKAIL